MQMLIEAYEVMYSSNLFPPRIWLRGEGRSLGQLLFHPNGATLPEDGQREDGQVDLHYHLDDFANILSVLREGPMAFLIYNGAGGGNENAIRGAMARPGESCAV